MKYCKLYISLNKYIVVVVVRGIDFDRGNREEKYDGSKISGCQQSFLTVLQWRRDNSNSDNSNSLLTGTNSNFPWI